MLVKEMFSQIESLRKSILACRRDEKSFSPVVICCDISLIFRHGALL